MAKVSENDAVWKLFKSLETEQLMVMLDAFGYSSTVTVEVPPKYTLVVVLSYEVVTALEVPSVPLVLSTA